jgi:hypothetical protein
MANRKVRMVVGISGERHDGRRWPPAGTVLTVPDWEAEDLIRGQNAVPVSQADDVPAAPPPVVSDPRPESQAAGEQLAAKAAAEEEAAGDETAPTPVVPPEISAVAQVSPLARVSGAEPDPGITPIPSAPKQAWIDYAIAQGATTEDASSMTKADLMSRYGGRL